MSERWRTVRKRLGRLVEELDPSVIDARDAAALVRECARIERLAGAAKTLLAARVAETRVWSETGERSAAHWLAKQSGTTVGSAIDTLATAQRLENCPATEDALRAGNLSLPQANEISSAAAADPDAERALVDRAERLSLRELRDECGRVRSQGEDREERRRRIHAQRRLRTHVDSDGTWNLHVRENPERGAELMSVLGPIRDELFEQARAEERHEPAEAYAADALFELARRARHGESANRSGRSSAKIIARIDAEALLSGTVADGEVCEIAGIGPVAVSAVRELVERGGVLAAVLTHAEEVRGVAHLGRRPTAKQQTALEWLYPTCANEGCGRTDHLEIDHREDWSSTKLTILDALDRLCGHCHDLKTRLGWALVDGSGVRPLVPPDDARHPRHRHQARPAAA